MFATVVGVRRVAGTAKASGNKFDLCRVLVLRPLECFANATVNVDAHGFEATELVLDEKALQSFKSLKFPAQVNLTIDARVGRQGLESVVIGHEPVKNLAAA
jgi:hypothetical protein